MPLIFGAAIVIFLLWIKTNIIIPLWKELIFLLNKSVIFLSNLINQLLIIATSFYAGVIYIVVLTLIYTHFLKKFINDFKRAKQVNREKKEKIDEGFSKIKEALKKDLEGKSSNALNDFLSELKSLEWLMQFKQYKEYEKMLKEKFEDCKEKLKEQKYVERIKQLKEEEKEHKEKNEEWNKLEEERKQNEEEKHENTIRRLEARHHSVYKKETLSEVEIEALNIEGFTEENEYCVFEKKRINILVNPPTNHSVQHTFLVWSIKRILDKNRKISQIDEHLAVGADIIFRYNNENYAIEVETGSLLRKKDQMKEKVGFLNRKYPNKWLFLVSNKELIAKYNKFGQAASRKNFAEKIKKMLNSS